MEFILNEPTCILEPSIDKGDLVSFVINKHSNIDFDMYEIDEEIKILDSIKKEKIIYGDFMLQTITKKYKTIINYCIFAIAMD